MKLEFWMAPEEAKAPIVLQPVAGADSLETIRANPVFFLATAAAEELDRRCPCAAARPPERVKALRAQKAAAFTRLFDLTDDEADELTLLGQTLGEGEVAGTVAMPGGVVGQIQESALAGLWRVRFQNAEGLLIGDYLEVASISEIVRRAALAVTPELSFGGAPIATHRRKNS